MMGLRKLAVITSMIGLGILGSVILSGASYPDRLFSYGTAIGMLMVFVSILLYVAVWCHQLFENVKSKNIIGIVLLVITAILFLIPFIKR